MGLFTGFEQVSRWCVLLDALMCLFLRMTYEGA